ncbi:GTP pyrophosphokinase family protein [Methylotenera sp.]|uniref:GTP pyrophosphokinase n=1 Tax=Methylotenera sp. TaxID=2051956 RepID=UPI0027322F88|nr:hypothetical protein [Methylotenera sp.]MDP3777993.1 hypothetical protein [Methylotenera sp.]
MQNKNNKRQKALIKTMENTATDKVWREKPELIRNYLGLLSKHEKLCEEVEYILKTKLRSAEIDIALVTSRAKGLSSYCEKIERKSYSDPLKNITDLAGARIVFLYLSDLPKIEKIIEKEFDIVEKENKLQNNDTEKFGYGALHYLVKIKKRHTGARYDDLRDLVCEIQVRTILQDAWSIVAHHLSYKHEADVPKSLMRKLNALSGLFETADDQFESLRTARNFYIESTEKEISENTPNTLKQKINLDNLIAYGTSKFPARRKGSTEGYAELLEELKVLGYKTLQDVESAVKKGINAAVEEEKEDPPMDDDEQLTEFNVIGLIRTSIAMVNEPYCKEKYSGPAYEKYKKYNLWVKT